ncbi:MAG: preprotein translocase subunit YajC [Lachnospiraceae bacterium]|nr:preprotein translocase subunit YajC [Lachnospiraceae bacterium]
MNWEVILWTCITLAVIMGVIASIMSIMSARGMKKRREHMLELYNGLSIGSQVLFANGLYGRVVGIEEETVNIEIAKGAIVKADRFSIQSIVK